MDSCPIHDLSPNAPSKRDPLGTVLLSVLSGHRGYAHITALRCYCGGPPLLGMNRVLSDDAIRRGFGKIEVEPGVNWLQLQPDHTLRGVLSEPCILDADTTVKPLHGHQEGAVVGYKTAKPGRPSHTYHRFMVANLRLMLEMEVMPGNQHTPKHSALTLKALLERLGPNGQPWLLRRDHAWGVEEVMRFAEGLNLPYLFRLRPTANVQRAIQRGNAGRGVDGCRPWLAKPIG